MVPLQFHVKPRLVLIYAFILPIRFSSTFHHYPPAKRRQVLLVACHLKCLAAVPIPEPAYPVHHEDPVFTTYIALRLGARATTGRAAESRDERAPFHASLPKGRARLAHECRSRPARPSAFRASRTGPRTFQHRSAINPLISLGAAKITSARSPIIPAGTRAGAPFCGPSSLTSVLNRRFRSQKSRLFPSAVVTL
jgi:hypothetical protein